MSERVPADDFTLGQFLQEEMDARGWTAKDVAMRMGGDIPMKLLCLEMTLAVREPGLILSGEMAGDLEKAFGVSAEFFRNIDAAWREHCARKERIAE